jgi:hypothetical protein
MQIIRPYWTAWGDAKESVTACVSLDCSSFHKFLLYLQNPDEGKGMANPGGGSGWIRHCGGPHKNRR